MRLFQTLFFGYPAVVLGVFALFTSDNLETSIAGGSFLIAGTILLVSTPSQAKREVSTSSETL